MQPRKLHSGVHCRQSILPTTKENLWRPNLREYTRRPYAASSPPQETDPSGTFSCNRSRLFRNRLLTMVRSRHVASTLCRSARQPFRWRSHGDLAQNADLFFQNPLKSHVRFRIKPSTTVPGTTRWHTHDIRLPCRSVARFPQKLPLLRSSTSTQATLPLYGVLIT